MSEPWTGWEPTVEAEPVLVGALLDRTDRLERAQRWAVALEQRLAEVRAQVADRGWYVLPLQRDLLTLIDAELVA